MSIACALVCLAGLSSGGAEVAAGATGAGSLQNDPSPPPAERRVALDVTATINGAPAGDISIETDMTGSARVNAAQLLTILEPIVSPATLAAFQARAAGADFIPVAELNEAGVSIAFDLASLRVNIIVPLEARSTGQLSIVDRSQFRRGGLTSPENFAAGLSLTFGQRFSHLANVGDIDRERFNILAEGFVNLGGIRGANLVFQGGYREDGRIVRNRTTLFHDDVENAIRYSAGDIDPQVFGAYSSPASIAGIGMERLYSTIQPFRNLRPAGRGSLIIERQSRVDVLVNGALYRTLDLAPGQYNIRNFPSLNGLNDVQLVVRDESGRTETTNVSFFSDIDLLDGDISIFSANIGFRRNRFGEFVSSAYEDSPIFSGFYVRGITDRLTLGGAVQVDKDNALVSGQAIVATPVGILAIEAAFDLNDVDAAQEAFTLSYRYDWPAEFNRTAGISIDVQYRSDKFSPMELAGVQPNRISWDLNGRYQMPLGSDVFASATAGYSWSRDGFDDVWTVGVAATRRFGLLNLSLNYTYRNDEFGADHRALVAISMPLGPRQAVRASYDTRANRVSADYQRIAFEGLDQTDLRMGVVRGDDGQGATADIVHYANRFRVAARHSYSDFDGARDQFTDISATFGIGYAGGRFALGRDAARGFAIVDRHRTLGNSEVVVSDTFSLGAAAKTGALGPALVPVRRAYQPTTLGIDVKDLPVGYDIGPGRYDTLPGGASGYAITIGSAASNTVLGRILDVDGKPLAYATGTLDPIEGEEARQVQFFTNRTGRMAVLKVAPGRYRIILAGESEPIGEVTVDEDAAGMVEVGEFKVGGSR